MVLFTRDLRVHDNPTLVHAADSGSRTVPLFVLDEAILRSRYNRPNRAEFLAGCLRDLDASLKGLGASGLVVRRGDVVSEVAAVVRETGADSVHVAGDVSAYAGRREAALRGAMQAADVTLCVHRGSVTVVPSGEITPSGGDHFSRFTAYHRRWEQAGTRRVLSPPSRVWSPRLRKGNLPAGEDICLGERSPLLPEGGESAGRRAVAEWLRNGVGSYADSHDDLAGDMTSRLSPYLHFGALSPLEIARQAGRSAGAQAFVRQLAWRDFHAQVLAARPQAAHQDYRPRGDRWRRDPQAFRAWQDGRTGYPIVDAAMRQLRHEGWMHNRGRLVVGSFLTKTLYLDWRLGARHFLDWLVDGDIANNQLNWQWVAGTGTDTRPNRVLNPLRQAERFDPRGDFVRRHLPELAGVGGPAVHQPWLLPADRRRGLDYPDPIEDLDEGRRRFLAARV